MSLRSTLLRARWLLLLLPLFALASTMQVGCAVESSDQRRDDFAHEDPKAGAPSIAKDRNYGYDDDGYYPYDDGEGTYGYE